MSKKYWVPSIERAHRVLQIISSHPAKKRLIDLSKELDINKSSMFSLLRTLEELQWIVKEKDDTYVLGYVFATLGNAFFQQFDLIERFQREAQMYRDRVGETVQLARREAKNSLYLAKLEAESPVRLLSEPGMTFPAHATAMGKMMLAFMDRDHLENLYPEGSLPQLARNTITDKAAFYAELGEIKQQGVATESEEAVDGFSCVAAPVFDGQHQIEAAVSFSMPVSHWPEKQELATQEIINLAKRLSYQ